MHESIGFGSWIVRAMFFLLMLSTSAFNQGATLGFEIGQSLSPELLQYIPKQQCLVGPSQVAPCIRVRLRGVIYTVGYDGKSKKVNYVETHDSAFVSATGLRVGSQLQPPGKLIWLGDYDEIVATTTTDGWQPVVAQGTALECEPAGAVSLNAGKTEIPANCPVRVLGFKKRALYQSKM